MQEKEVTLTLVSNRAIQRINRQWRNVNRPTDCISFPLSDDYKLFPNILGDIFISLEMAYDQAREHWGHTTEDAFKQEIIFLFIHSLLHLLGYDHIKEEDRLVMEKKEREVLQKLKVGI